MTICNHCGKSIDDNSAFCKYCGTKVPVFSIDYIFSLKQWTIDKEDGRPESKHINSWNYYGFEKDAKYNLEREFSLMKRVASNNADYSMGEMYSFETTKGPSFWEKSKPCNSADKESIVEYFDHYHLYKGKRWHSRYEITVAKFNPPINMKRSEREDKHVYVLEDSVVLNDDINNYQGYTTNEEFYSDEVSAMKRLEQLKSSYPTNRIGIRDWRKRFWANYEKYGPNGWYGIVIYDEHQHIVRTINIVVSIIR